MSINRIKEMEARLDRVIAWMDGRGPSAEEELRLLDTYYTSGEWLEDYEADERGELPPNLKRGVLSQDTLFDILEKNRMQKKNPPGESFNSFSAERLEILKKTRHMIDEYNNTAFEEAEKRNELLQKMLGSCGDDVTIQTPFKVVYGKNLHIGNHVFINYNSSFIDGGEIRIGSRVLIGPDTKIYAGNHSLKAEERIVIENGKMRLISIPQPVTIGDDVWIGGNVTILPGVTVGSEAVIAAGSVVVKNVPERVLVAGNPAKVVKEI